MRRSLLVAALALAGLTTRVWSADPVAPTKVCCEPRSLLSGCPDDYCRKPFPRIDTVSCGWPDDYCRKPYPRTWTLPCGGPDDYCRKPCPNLGRPLNPDYYTCGRPGCQGAAQGVARRVAREVAREVAQSAVMDKKTGQVR